MSTPEEPTPETQDPATGTSTSTGTESPTGNGATQK